MILKHCLSTLSLIFCMLQTSVSQQPVPPKDSVLQLSPVVVSASKYSENILQAPVSIEQLSQQAIRQSAQPSFFDAIENLKGIHLITPSLGFKVINARGFTNTTNVRFVQMVEGMDIQAPHIGAPMANTLGPGDLDVLSVEVLPGAASALYGMNAINGTANFLIKDPFLYQGLDVSQRSGVNHLGDPESGAAIFNESSIRWSRAFSDKWAIKLNATYTRGLDWYANNLTDLSPNLNVSTGLTGALNPGKDRVNIYADESSNRRTISLGGKQYVISRTGYAEKEMADYHLDNKKADFNIAFRPAAGLSFNYTFRVAQTNTVYQRTNRFRLDNYLTSQHSLSLKSKSIQFRAYTNGENTGDSYNIRSMAENAERGFKTDNQWFADFTAGFNRSVGTGTADAMIAARVLADLGRPLPYSAQTDSIIARLREINNWDLGAALRVRAQLYHAEVQHNLTDGLLKKIGASTKLSLMYGADYRIYVVVPDGNYFINPLKAGSNLHYWKAGGFLQATRYFAGQKLKANAVLRLDKNQYFHAKINPRLAVVYSPTENHNFRFAVQQGYRFPSLFEAFSNINSGGVKRVGGLPVMSSGIFENSYLRTSIDAFQAANTADVNTRGLTISQAVQKNQGILQRNNYTYLNPEKIQSLELGYRSSLLNDKLAIDADLYYNIYKNLMAQVEANIPRAGSSDSLLFMLNDRQRQDRYRLWTNSKTISFNYGGTVGISWNFLRSYRASGNLSLAKLSRKTGTDGLEDAFNTPSWIYNFTLGNPEVWRGIGFQLNYRSQTAYQWQSSLATGAVAAYSTVDAQVQYHPKKDKWRIKVGGTNLLNKYYYSYIGGPMIGGLYYCTLTAKVF